MLRHLHRFHTWKQLSCAVKQDSYLWYFDLLSVWPWSIRQHFLHSTGKMLLAGQRHNICSLPKPSSAHTYLCNHTVSERISCVNKCRQLYLLDSSCCLYVSIPHSRLCGLFYRWFIQNIVLPVRLLIAISSREIVD